MLFCCCWCTQLVLDPPLQPQQQQSQYNPQSSHIQYSTPQLKPPQSIQQHTGQSPLILQPVQQPTI